LNVIARLSDIENLAYRLEEKYSDH
jgi:hypothetical protein